MEPLNDAVNDRVVKEVPAPPHRPLSEELLYPTKSSNMPNWEVLKTHMYKEGRVSREHC